MVCVSWIISSHTTGVSDGLRSSNDEPCVLEAMVMAASAGSLLP